MVPAADPLPLPVRVALEALAGASVSVATLILSDQMTALLVTVGIAAIGGIVWLVRLEGQIKGQKLLIENQQRSLDEINQRLQRLVEHLGGV